MPTKRGIASTLRDVESRHGDDVGVEPALTMSMKPPGSFPPEIEEAAKADFEARCRLGFSYGMFILSDDTIEDFRERVAAALEHLEDETGSKVAVGDYIEYIHASRTDENTAPPSVYFDGELSNDEAAIVWEWTIRQPADDYDPENDTRREERSR